MLDFLSPPKIVSDARDSLCLFILLSSEKNEQRNAAAVIGPFGLSLRSPSGGCGTRSAQTVLALFPPSPLRLRRPIKAESGIVTVAVFFNPSVLRTPPLYFPTETQGRRLNSSCSPHKSTRPQKKKNPLLPIF